MKIIHKKKNHFKAFYAILNEDPITYDMMAKHLLRLHFEFITVSKIRPNGMSPNLTTRLFGVFCTE